jgi:hypothetical protein
VSGKSVTLKAQAGRVFAIYLRGIREAS